MIEKFIDSGFSLFTIFMKVNIVKTGIFSGILASILSFMTDVVFLSQGMFYALTLTMMSTMILEFVYEFRHKEHDFGSAMKFIYLRWFKLTMELVAFCLLILICMISSGETGILTYFPQIVFSFLIGVQTGALISSMYSVGMIPKWFVDVWDSLFGKKAMMKRIKKFEEDDNSNNWSYHRRKRSDEDEGNISSDEYDSHN